MPHVRRLQEEDATQDDVEEFFELEDKRLSCSDFLQNFMKAADTKAFRLGAPDYHSPANCWTHVYRNHVDQPLQRPESYENIFNARNYLRHFTAEVCAVRKSIDIVLTCASKP